MPIPPLKKASILLLKAVLVVDFLSASSKHATVLAVLHVLIFASQKFTAGFNGCLFPADNTLYSCGFRCKVKLSANSAEALDRSPSSLAILSNITVGPCQRKARGPLLEPEEAAIGNAHEEGRFCFIVSIVVWVGPSSIVVGWHINK